MLDLIKELQERSSMRMIIEFDDTLKLVMDFGGENEIIITHTHDTYYIHKPFGEWFTIASKDLNHVVKEIIKLYKKFENI